jgi:hypothetical protein
MDKTSRQALARADEQSQRLPEDAACARCGERDIRALIPRSIPLLCQTCANLMAGRPVFERHHIASRHSADDRVALRPTEHRIMTDMQIDWGRRRMENREGNPLVTLENMLRGANEAAVVLLQRALGYEKVMPELQEDLTELLGPGWWARCPRFMAAMAHRARQCGPDDRFGGKDLGA